MKKHEFTSEFKQSLINKGVSVQSRPYYHRHITQWGRYLRARKEGGCAEENEAVSLDHSAVFKGWLSELGGNPCVEDF